MEEKYVFLILGVILGASIVVYWWISREQRIEREIQVNQEVFSTTKLDSTMQDIVEKIKRQMSFLKRKLTEDEKNEIIENCLQNHISSK